MKWEDRPTMTSVREDGARVGAWWIDGKIEWWAYLPDGGSSGPHATMGEAKKACDAWLFGGINELPQS